MQRRRPLSKTANNILITAVVLITTALFTYAFIFIASLYGKRILTGVSVDGILLSGMTRQQAHEALVTMADDRVEGLSLTLQYMDHTWLLGAEDIGAAFDFDSLLNNVGAVGHTGSFRQRIKEKRAAKNRQINFNLWDYFRAPLLESRIKEVRDEIYVPCKEPYLTIVCDGFAFTLGGDAYYKDGVDYSPLFVFSPGDTGLDIDMDAVMQAAFEDLGGDGSAGMVLSTQTIFPEQTQETLRQGATHLFHSVSKLVSSTDERNHNIMTALKNFDGMVIEPGETVSFYDIVGEPLKKSGQAISSVPFEPEGGFSQAATTLYNAVLMAGCEIIERHPHQWSLYYLDYDYGLDAYVKRDEYDLVFKNTTGGRLYIDCYFCYYEDRATYVDIDIYGMPPGDGSAISVKGNVLGVLRPGPAEYIHIQELRDDMIWEYDQTLGFMTATERKEREGMNVQVVRTWSKDGDIIKSEELYTTKYEPVRGIIYTRQPTAHELESLGIQ